ncbi:MAG: ACP S-malonyltransferase [Dehalococcoidia bacterium]
MTTKQYLTEDVGDAIRRLERDDTVAYIFPGQGSQYVGMAKDVAESSSSARRIFDIADEILEFALSALCFEGPEDELRATSNAQPAILTASLGILAAALETGALQRCPAFMAGHSLGQYTALVAAGSLRFEDALRLVRERGLLMEEAGRERPGTMAAIVGLDEATVTGICGESGAEACNYNLESQMVVGGEPDAVERARKLARERGGKGLPIKVSGAFHTSLMRPAAEKLRAVLAGTSVAEPMNPVISNVTGEPVGSGDEMLSDLADQIVSPVRWHQSINLMLSRGTKTFIEIGPGEVLTTMLKRHSADFETTTLNSAEAIRRPANV